MNCNCTEEIIDQKMLVYGHCASIQTANYFLSKTVLELNDILRDINNERRDCIDDSTKANEIIINDHDGTEEWCILK